MSLAFKPGVKLAGICPEMVMGHLVVQSAFEELDQPCIITSGNDSTHSDTSRHYIGCALDYRTRHLAPHHKALIMGRIKVRLGDDFYVALEDEGGENEHLHCSWKAKRS